MSAPGTFKDVIKRDRAPERPLPVDEFLGELDAFIRQDFRYTADQRGGKGQDQDTEHVQSGIGGGDRALDGEEECTGEIQREDRGQGFQLHRLKHSSDRISEYLCNLLFLN